MKETNSRGKRNRIKKRIQKLNGELPEAKLTSQKEKTSVKKSSKKQKTQEAEENEEVEELEEKRRNGSKNIQLSKETKKLLNIRNKSKDQIIEDEIKAEAKKNKRKKKQK